MIAQLTGKILHTNPPQMVLEVGDIGYEVLCPLNTFYKLKNNPLDNTKHTIHTQLIVRDDSHTLYGFNSVDEKTVFNELMRVSGVGAKVALAILSTLSIRDILSCVANDEVGILQQTPGIGKKTAQKMIVELQDRLPKLNLANHATKNKAGNISASANQVALSALLSLGFKEKEAQKMLVGIDTSLSTAAIIRLALQNK